MGSFCSRLILACVLSIQTGAGFAACAPESLEVRGPNGQDRKIQLAVQAGIARRAYLKGMGEARGCRYPARSAGPAELAALTAPQGQAQAQSETRPDHQPSRKQRSKGVTFVAQPVVQRVKK